MVWHRKARKTTLGINQLLRACAHTPDVYWYVAPQLNQARRIVWDDPMMLARYVPPQIWAKRNNSDHSIPFPNGSRLYVLGADNPDALRGPNPRGVFLDEYGSMKKEIWTGVIQPIMTFKPDAWTWFSGTPAGANDFRDKFQYAATGDDPDWMCSRLRASESGLITKDQLEEARRTSTEAFFNQEYECEFLEGGTQFFRRVKNNLYTPSGIAPVEHRIQLGVDLAKYQDWTVITPFDLNSFHALPQDRFNQVDWNLQKAKISLAYYKYTNQNYGSPLVRLDATGVGDPIAEDLIREGMNLDPFKFTEKSRRALLDHLAILLEGDRIKLPNDEGLISELQSIRFELGEGGKVRVVTPEGLHDDRVMSLALAVWGAHEKEAFEPGSSDSRSQDLFNKYDLFNT